MKYLAILSIMFLFSCSKKEEEKHCWKVSDNCIDVSGTVCDKTDAEISTGGYSCYWRADEANNCYQICNDTVCLNPESYAPTQVAQLQARGQWPASAALINCTEPAWYYRYERWVSGSQKDSTLVFPGRHKDDAPTDGQRIQVGQSGDTTYYRHYSNNGTF